MFKLDHPAAEVRVARAVGLHKEVRATEAFIGQCPTIEVLIKGVDL